MKANDANGDPRPFRLLFEGGFDERAAVEAESRGYRAGVQVELSDGRRYGVVFYDPVRLAQDVQTEAQIGSPFIGEPGLIVVSDVNLANMEAAVAKLLRQHFFDSFIPCTGPLRAAPVESTRT